MYNSRIIGLGKYLPENIVTNADLSKMMDTSDEWINERTGIKERRHIKKGDGNTTATMALKATKIALERANMAAGRRLSRLLQENVALPQHREAFVFE